MIYLASNMVALIDRKFEKLTILQSRTSRFKRLLRAGASGFALMIAGIAVSAPPARADPSITYSGVVTPPPPPGTVNWVLDRDIRIGVFDGAGGELAITGGATLLHVGSRVYILGGDRSVSKFIVDGKGSTATIQNGVYVGKSGFLGDNGAGCHTAFIISNGGSVNVTGWTYIGNGTDDYYYRVHSAELIVTGAGSSLDISNGSLSVKNKGFVDMTISDGATIKAGSFFLYSSAEYGASATIAGANSALNLAAFADLSGRSTLNLKDGGTLNADALSFSGGDIASNRILNIGGEADGPAQRAGNLNVSEILFDSKEDKVLGNSIINFNTINGTTVGATISGYGTLNQIAGRTTLTGDNSFFDGTTNVIGGVLTQGADNAFSAQGQYNVERAGLLDLGGYATILGSLSNSGEVYFDSRGGTYLHVQDDYVGSDGSVYMTAVLGGDDSKTDRLTIGGNTSGNTLVNVANAGGTGAPTVNGIPLITVGGQSNGTFTLSGGYVTKDRQPAVVAGAYAYTLQKGSGTGKQDGNWYLVSNLKSTAKAGSLAGSGLSDSQSGTSFDITVEHEADNAVVYQPRYSAGAPVYEGYVQTMQALNKLPSLQQRVGNRSFTGSNDSNADHGTSVNEYGLWGRVSGGHNRLEPSTSTARMKQDINTLQMQTGVDGQLYEGKHGRLIAGMTGQYGHAKGDISSLYGDGSISTDAWSLGATATWYGNDGFYVDTQGQLTWFKSDLDSWTANQGLVNGRKATGYALSAEAGKRMAIGGNWSLTPQAQLAWSSIHADAFRDVWDARVSVKDGSSLLGRLGLAAEYGTEWKDESGHTTHANVYGIANIYQEFMSETTVNLAGVDFNTDNDRTWAGVGAGGTLSWADNKYALYGEGSINTGLNHFAQSYSLKGNLGFKVKW